MIAWIKDLLDEGPVILHFDNGENIEIVSINVMGKPAHTYHAVTNDGKKIIFNTPYVITFVSSK